MKKLLALIFVLALSGLTWILPSPSPVVADDPAPALSPVVVVTGEPEPEPVIEVTSEPAPEPEPVIEVTSEPVLTEHVIFEDGSGRDTYSDGSIITFCLEGQLCDDGTDPDTVANTEDWEWNWETEDNRTSGVTVTLYTGEVWTGNLTANDDGTYTFVRK